MKLKDIVESSDTRAGLAFDIISQSLVIVSLIAFAIETGSELPTTAQRLLDISEMVIVLLFTAEYLLRLIVADRKLKFVFSFYGMVDLIAILPFYLCTGMDLRSIRVFRLVRLIRFFKFFRYGRVIDRFKIAYRMIRNELLLVGGVSLLLLYVSSVGIYYCEHEAQPEQFGSVMKCFWFSIITLTTIGYGDAIPITVVGKIFTSFISLIGIGVIAVPTGLITASLVKAAGSDKTAGSEIPETRLGSSDGGNRDDQVQKNN